MKALRYILKIFNIVLNIFFPFGSRAKMKKKALRTHIIFTKFKIWKYRIPHLKNIPDIKRVFKDVLLIKFSEWEEGSKKFIREYGSRKFSNNAEFHDFVSSFFDKMVVRYDQECLDNGIPIEVLNAFNKWHSPKVKFLKDRIKDVAYSSFYSSYTEKMDAILILLSTGLVFILTDAEKTIKDVNGSLTEKFERYNESH